MKSNLIRSILLSLRTIGINPRRLIYLRHLPKYISDYCKFKKAGGIITNRYMVLNDYFSEAGSASGHYFHQDLLVASFIYQTKPSRHVDIGSRIDGFVAHVAAFREIEVMDLRDLQDTGHKNIKFIRSDLMDEVNIKPHLADSLSCLHAIEHFGLGRYGDPIDPNGHIKGFNNILKMLKDGGTLYISFPIGSKNSVYFNSHRVFHPKDIFTWAEDSYKITLLRFDFVDDFGRLHQNHPLDINTPNLIYGCGIYTFRKDY